MLGVLACGSPPADKGANKETAGKANTTAKQADPPPAPAKPAEPTAVEPTPPPAEPPPSEQPEEPADADIRSDAVVPPNTPATNAEAFMRLPKSKADGPPVSAIASNGLHFDVLVVGRGWEKSRCVEETRSFRSETDDRVNICVRVVHPSDAAESLTVEWQKVGTKSKRHSTISVKAMHAYLTRGYLPIKPGYEGEWVATVRHADGTVLATLPFTVE